MKKEIKKILKIILINLLALVLLLVMSEVILFNITKSKIENQFKIRQEMNKKIGAAVQSDFKYSLSVESFDYNSEKSRMRKPEGLSYKKPPILLFGCSYTYGDGLYNKDTFSYKLSHFTKRPVYNRAMQGWGTQHMLYQLKRNDFYNEVKTPEYVIYTFIPDHLNRLYRYQYPPPYNYILLRYKLTQNGYEEIKPFCKPLWGLYTVNEIQNLIEKNILTSDKNKDKNFEYFYKMMIESRKIINKHYPKAKFVILVYRCNDKFPENCDYWWKKFQNTGFIVISTDQLLKPGTLEEKPYTGIDGFHPSGKAWDVIVPSLAKKLNL